MSLPSGPTTMTRCEADTSIRLVTGTASAGSPLVSKLEHVSGCPMMPPSALTCDAAARQAFCAFRPKNAFCPVNACSTPAVTGKVPLPLALGLPGALAEDPPEVLDPLEEHPAMAIEAAVAATQATIHRCLISIVAQTSTLVPREIA